MTVVNKMLQLEEKYNLNSFSINGFRPWIYVRVNIVDELSYPEYYKKRAARALKNQHMASCEGFVKKIKRCCCVLYKMLIKDNKLKKNVDILFLTNARRQLKNGKYECVYTDKLADIFANSMSVENTVHGMRYAPIRTKNLVYLDELFFFRRKAYGIVEKYMPKRKKRYEKIYDQILTYMEKPLAELYSFFHMDISSEKWIHEMTKRYFWHRHALKLYRRLLLKTKPGLIIQVCHYVFDFMVINEITKELGITTIELQHGVIHKGHFAYIYPKGEKILQFPDYFFLFSEYWKELIACPIDEDKLISVGYPHFDSGIAKYENTLSERKTENKTIVFLSEPGVGLDKLAVDINNRINKMGWSIIFKLHPREYHDWKINYPALLNSDINVVDTPDISLYEIFSKSSAAIGVTSTTLYEAISFGLTTFIYDSTFFSIIQHLCDKGFATKLTDSDSLCLALETLDDKHFSRNTTFFKPYALENMKEVISNMLGKA